MAHAKTPPASAATPGRTSAPPDRIRPVAALRALRALIRDPDDTARVFEVVDALSGRSGARLYERFRRTPTGARLLRERPDLRAHLTDTERLAALPPGSLGHVYADFMRREQISADGLVEASVRGKEDWSGAVPEERIWFMERLRDMHDLWHVATGYERDLVGESSLLAFTWAQTRNRGLGLIVAAAWLKAGAEHPAARRVIREAHRRGKSAAWLPGQHWEALLPRPLDELRRELGLGEPPRYEQVRSAGAPVLAA